MVIVTGGGVKYTILVVVLRVDVVVTNIVNGDSVYVDVTGAGTSMIISVTVIKGG